MAANLCSENTTESLRNGFLELGIVQVWQVITATRTTTAAVVLSDPQLPPLGVSQIFGTYEMWPIDRSAQRVDEDQTGRKWYVTYNYSNNTGNYARDVNGDPVSDPTDAVKNVTISYQEYDQPIADAVYDSQTEGGGYSEGTPLTDDPPWLAGLNATGSVRVSSGEPVLATRIAYRQIIEVSRIEENWTSTYEEYTNA